MAPKASGGREEYAKNEARLNDVNAEIAKLLAEKQALESKQEASVSEAQSEATAENRLRDDFEAAKVENQAFDEAKAREAEEKAAAEAAAREKKKAEDVTKQAEDAEKAAKLAEQIKGGQMGIENENQSSNTELNQEGAGIENESLSPVLQKYSTPIEKTFSEYQALIAQAEKLRAEGKEREAIDVEIQANRTSARILNGGGDTFDDSFLEYPKRNRSESYEQWRKQVDAVGKEYYRALADSPQMILRLARETGRLDFENISGRLLRDKQFISVLAQTEAAKKDAKFQVALRDNLFGQYAARARY